MINKEREYQIGRLYQADLYKPDVLPEGDYILIMPFARPWQDKDGKWMDNAKSYPYWSQLVQDIHLVFPDMKIIQTGAQGEPQIQGVNEVRHNLSLKKMTALLKGAKTFISCDTYLQHLGAYYDKRGIVLWGQNNPKHFGHKLHVNLYNSSKYFRPETWAVWQGYPRKDGSFVRPGVVLAALKEELKRQEELPVKTMDELYPPIPGVSWAGKYAPELREGAPVEILETTTATLDNRPIPAKVEYITAAEARETIQHDIERDTEGWEGKFDNKEMIGDNETLFKELQLEVH